MRCSRRAVLVILAACLTVPFVAVPLVDVRRQRPVLTRDRLSRFTRQLVKEGSR